MQVGHGCIAVRPADAATDAGARKTRLQLCLRSPRLALQFLSEPLHGRRAASLRLNAMYAPSPESVTP